MSVPGRLRVAGWIVSILGGGIYIFSGGLGAGFAAGSYLPMAGALVMVLGIIITSTGPLVATLQARRQISARLTELENARSETPEPPK